MSYTNFGKFLRKKMIDKDENLGDLALLFNTSIPFISSVLLGKKNIPDKWLEIIKEHYILDLDEMEEMNKYYEEAKTAVKIQLIDCNNEQRSLALQFQRRLSGLSDEELKQISKILGDNNGLSNSTTIKK